MRFKVLTNWQPKTLSHKTIKRGLNGILRRRGIGRSKYPTEVRDPARNRITSRRTDDWHQDEYGKSYFLVLWANKLPSQIRLKGKRKLLNIKNGDVVIFQNQDFKHRIPPECRLSRTRWWARRFLLPKEVPTHIFNDNHSGQCV